MYFPQAQEQSDGKHKILVFEQGMQQMVKQAMACDYEGDALLLSKAARIVRKDIASHKGFHFDGKLGSSCQQESVPSTLKTIVSMLLNGAARKTRIPWIRRQILQSLRPFSSTSRIVHLLLQRIGSFLAGNHHCHSTLE